MKLLLRLRTALRFQKFDASLLTDDTRHAAAPAVEQLDLVAGTRPQRLEKVVAFPRIQRDGLPRISRQFCKKCMHGQQKTFRPITLQPEGEKSKTLPL